jgi:hypothetical protein
MIPVDYFWNMPHYQKIDRYLWLVIAVLCLIGSLTGLIHPDIYQNFVNSDLLPGLTSQDLISAGSGCILLFYSLSSKSIDYRRQIIIIGILGYLFYAYGIYVIEQFYNMLYILYMGIFSLSFYALISGLIGIDSGLWFNLRISGSIRVLSAIFLFLNPLVFYPLWISQIISFIVEGRQPVAFYSVYILDLCFVMPAMVIVATMAFKKKGFGILLQPSLLIWGFILLFSVALGGLVGLIQNGSINLGETGFYLALSLVFLGLAILYFRHLKIWE